jgi:hypothetical protein
MGDEWTDDRPFITARPNGEIFAPARFAERLGLAGRRVGTDVSYGPRTGTIRFTAADGGRITWTQAAPGDRGRRARWLSWITDPRIALRICENGKAVRLSVLVDDRGDVMPLEVGGQRALFAVEVPEEMRPGARP